MIKKEYIPNILTILRIFLIPIFIFYVLEKKFMIALICFFVASITDWADGYFARKFDVESEFGAFWDPLADKLLVLSAFYSFLQIKELDQIVYIWMVVVISFRDISITALRIILQSKDDLVLVTSKIAKLKTFLQLVTIIWILCFLAFQNLLIRYDDVGYLLMLTTTLITLYTGLHYYYNNGKKLIYAISNK